MMNAYKRNIYFEVLVIIFGILGIVISAISLSIFGKTVSFDSQNMFSLVSSLNFLSRLEMFIKPVGLLLGVIVFLMNKTTNKGFALFGLVLNVISVAWTLYLMYW